MKIRKFAFAASISGLCAAGLLLSADALALDADAAQALAKKEGCTKCHAVDKKKEAKSLTEISKSLKGKADAEATAIYAAAYSLDPDFFAFYKTLESYRDVVGGNTSLVLSSDSQIYQYLKSVSGK